jgi:D-sedoheptulose 7-phosphate isomerase
VSIDSTDAVRRHLLRLADGSRTAADEIAGQAVRYAELIRETLLAGGKILYAGNGGSAAAAEHIATEYVVRLKRERRALPALALTANTAQLSAAANDYGFERVFARVLEAHAKPGDLLVLHSTSGNSTNLLEVARVAREIPVRTVALLDRHGGKLAPLVDLAIRLPADDSAAVQELQLAVEHSVAELVEGWLVGDAEDG